MFQIAMVDLAIFIILIGGGIILGISGSLYLLLSSFLLILHPVLLFRNEQGQWTMTADILSNVFFFLFLSGLALMAVRQRQHKTMRWDLDRMQPLLRKYGVQIVTGGYLFLLLVYFNPHWDRLVLTWIFIMSIVFKWDSRIPASIALFLLASLPVLLFYKKEALVETIAIRVYYLLIITIVLTIREFKRNSTSDFSHDEKYSGLSRTSRG